MTCQLDEKLQVLFGEWCVLGMPEEDHDTDGPVAKLQRNRE
jgi:hypothetical protein